MQKTIKAATQKIPTIFNASFSDRFLFIVASFFTFICSSQERTFGSCHEHVQHEKKVSMCHHSSFCTTMIKLLINNYARKWDRRKNIGLFSALRATFMMTRNKALFRGSAKQAKVAEFRSSVTPLAFVLLVPAYVMLSLLILTKMGLDRIYQRLLYLKRRI